jgi:SAM-dependent methyltransferase
MISLASIHRFREAGRSLVKSILPVPIRRWMKAQKRCWSKWPPVGWTRFGSLRCVKPISPIFGLDRGPSIDRYYIETFLREHSAEIRGRVLEIGDSAYTREFGGDRVSRSDVLHVTSDNPRANLVGNLATGENIPRDAFNCLILTQVFNVIYDVKAAVSNSYQALKPGGVLLATFPGISQISRYDMDRWGDYWRFTSLSARQLFEEFFLPANVSVLAYGNVLTALAFLHGLAVEELKKEELNHRDPDYEVLVAVRAVKTFEASR